MENTWIWISRLILFQSPPAPAVKNPEGANLTTVLIERETNRPNNQVPSQMETDRLQQKRNNYD